MKKLYVILFLLLLFAGGCTRYILLDDPQDAIKLGYKVLDIDTLANNIYRIKVER